MKIAILASGNAEKALHLHEFFKEGNRITVDSLLTDNPDAEITRRMKEEGIDVFYILPGQTDTGMAELLKARQVELLVVDDFSGEIPSELTEAFAGAIVWPSGVASAPLEVIKAGEKGKTQPAESRPGPAEQAKVSDLEQEWAEVLEEEIEEAEAIKEEIAEEIVREEIADAKQAENMSPDMEQPPVYGSQVPPYSSGQPSFRGPGPMFQQQPLSEPMPDTYLLWSVIITILCCLIPGVVAIIYSASVSSRYYAGDIEGAKRASRNAQIWCIVSVIAGIIWATLYLPLSLLLA